MTINITHKEFKQTSRKRISKLLKRGFALRIIDAKVRS